MTLGWSIDAAARDSATKRSRNSSSRASAAGDELQRDHAVEIELHGAVHDAHAAAPGDALDAVTGEHVSGLDVGHRRKVHP